MKASQAGLDIELHVGLAERLPFGDGTFDAVASLLLWTLLEPVVAVDEWRRVVRPEGRILAVDRAHDSAHDRPGTLLDRALSRRACATAQVVTPTRHNAGSSS
ncbi:MAG: class I SAM-dependent methyltransferase [Pseudonocardiaceae bacterium]